MTNSNDNGKKIRQILVDQVGWIYSEGVFGNEDDSPIEVFFVNGEMALVTWYRKGNKEFNGKFVIEVEYYAQ